MSDEQKPEGRNVGLSAGLDGFEVWWRGRRYDVDCPSDRRIAEDAWQAARGEKYYPCARCGCWRTKAEGGTTFTVCDDCWDKPPPSNDGLSGGEPKAKPSRLNP